MARLAVVLEDGKHGFADVVVRQEHEDDMDGLFVDMRVCSADGRLRAGVQFGTGGWQVGRVYLEVLARSMILAKEYSAARFPVSYYADGGGSKPHCSLHHNLDRLHVLMRGGRDNTLCIDLFLRDAIDARFEYVSATCRTDSAVVFGNNLLQEINDTGARQGAG